MHIFAEAFHVSTNPKAYNTKKPNSFPRIFPLNFSCALAISTISISSSEGGRIRIQCVWKNVWNNFPSITKICNKQGAAHIELLKAKYYFAIKDYLAALKASSLHIQPVNKLLNFRFI